MEGGEGCRGLVVVSALASPISPHLPPGILYGDTFLCACARPPGTLAAQGDGLACFVTTLGLRYFGALSPSLPPPFCPFLPFLPLFFSCLHGARTIGLFSFAVLCRSSRVRGACVRLVARFVFFMATDVHRPGGCCLSAALTGAPPIASLPLRPPEIRFRRGPSYVAPPACLLPDCWLQDLLSTACMHFPPDQLLSQTTLDMLPQLPSFPSGVLFIPLLLLFRSLSMMQ